MKKPVQLEMLKKLPKSYGGELLKTRKSRSAGRPLDTRNTIHLVLRSTKAKGEWSFKRPKNDSKIRDIVKRFSQKFGVKTLSVANVGNHLHLQIKLGNRFTYAPFIRSLTASIAMAVTGASRWKPFELRLSKKNPNEKVKDSFWDYRPFSRVIQSLRGFLNLRDYMRINQMEGFGFSRVEARFIIARDSLSGGRSTA